MTVEEIINAANNGDKDAALGLAQFYEESDFDDKYDKALFWYEKAAYAGSPSGLVKAMAVHKVKASTQKSLGDWEEMSKHIGSILSLYNYLLDHSDAYADEVFEIARKLFRYTIYLVAVEGYLHNDYETALRRLRELDEDPVPLTRILRGCALFDYALEREAIDGEVVKSVYNDLCVLEQNPKAVIDDSTDGADEYILASGFFYLSGILRNAPFNDLERAYTLLGKGLKQLNTDAGQNMLREEMACYQPKLFGGYKYVSG